VKKKLTVLLSLFFVLLVVMGCITPPVPAGTTQLTINAADFESDRNGILTLNNFSSTDVAVFAGRVDRGNFIGAIKARGSRQFDLTKIPNLPKSGAFLFRVTTYEVLNKKGKVGITEEDVIYTGLVSYDGDRPDRQINQDIFRNIDDQFETFVYVTNLSKYVVELRLDSSTGDKVGVLSPGHRNKKLWIKRQSDGLPYRFFPTYIYVNPNTGEMDAFTDTVNLTGQQFIPMPASSIQAVYEFKDPKDQPGGKQFNVAFIKLNNDSNSL
jgi:hypothetical protein